MARLLTKALKEFDKEKEIRLKHALKSYQQGEITLMEAAEVAGVPLWEILEIVREKKIPMHYTLEDVEKDIKSV